jgi:hypothetical protein
MSSAAVRLPSSGGTTHVEGLHVGQDLEPIEVLSRGLEMGSGHVVQMGGPHSNDELKASELLLVQPRLITKFPIATLLCPAHVDEAMETRLQKLSYAFSRTGQKAEVLQLIEKNLFHTVKSQSLRSDIATIADELLTNAIFNAPYVNEENTSPGLSRSSAGSMPAGMSGQFFLGATEDRVLIGCRDPYGSLNVGRLLERIKNCYANSVAGTMNMSAQGGAGIGSFMVFNASSSYVVAVEKGKITVVCAILGTKGSSRARQEAPKNLHVIDLAKEAVHG